MGDRAPDLHQLSKGLEAGGGGGVGTGCNQVTARRRFDWRGSELGGWQEERSER